jgi:hypothetical protein
MPGGIESAMLASAALRALRRWLFELGHENATVGSAAGGMRDVYHLLNVGRLVQVKAAVSPSFPQSLSADEIHALRRLARRRDALAWEARIIVRSNFHAAAILWRNAEAPGDATRPLWFGGHRSCAALAAG